MRDSGRAPRPFQINKPRVASERGVQPSCGGNKIQGPKTGGTEQRIPNWSKAWSGRSRLRLRTGATVLRNSGLLIKSKLSPSPSRKVGGRDIFARSAMIAGVVLSSRSRHPSNNVDAEGQFVERQSRRAAFKIVCAAHCRSFVCPPTTEGHELKVSWRAAWNLCRLRHVKCLGQLR